MFVIVCYFNTVENFCWGITDGGGGVEPWASFIAQSSLGLSMILQYLQYRTLLTKHDGEQL
jgi:hypothetical protein